MNLLKMPTAALLAALGLISISSTLAGQPVSGNGRCESQLHFASAQVKETSSEGRANIWQNLRSLRRECETPGVDPVLSAEAALLYLMLPEFNTPDRELVVLAELESRLRGVEGAESVLIKLLDRSSGQQFVARRYDKARLKAEEALQLRRGYYGAGSFEEAMGLLYVGQLYVGIVNESGRKAADVQTATDYAQRAVASYVESHDLADSRLPDLLMQVEELYRDLHLSAEETTALIKALPRPEPQ